MPDRGVFWDVDSRLYAFPFTEDYISAGLSRSGNTYAHKNLWAAVRPKGCGKSYNYYPRGRVEITPKGKAIIYMNPCVDRNLIPDIIDRFGLEEAPRIIYDNSVHYKCHFDDGWKADRTK
ncbi:MAG: hypothetical protein LUF32_08345 [Clostridiales bacterium]|nr:hypothetical protein [Clostridiales bacterium]